MSEVLSAPQEVPSHLREKTRKNERRWQRLDALLNVRLQERWPVAMMWAHSFFLGLAVAYLTSSSLPIFLAAFDVRLLPHALMIAAALQFSLGLVNNRIERRYAKSELASFAVIAISAGSLIAFTGLLALPTAIAAFAVLVWSRVQRSMVQSEFWGLTSILFDLRESKRLFSLIDSGSVLAKIIGFFSVPLLLRFLPVSNLLIIAAITPIVSYGILRKILRRYGHSIDHAAHASLLHRHGIGIRSEVERAVRVERSIVSNEKQVSILRSAFAFMLRHRYTASISLVSTFAVIAMNAIDFGFLREIDLKYSQQTNVASILAIIFGSAQIISLLVKTGLVGRLFERFGAIRISALLPVALLVILVFGLFVSNDSGSAPMIWFFIALAVFAEVYSDAIHEPAIAIAYQPLHGHERLEARRVVDDVVEPLALGLAALVLLFLTLLTRNTLSELSYLLVAIFGLWGVSGMWFVQQYKRAISVALKRKPTAGATAEPQELSREAFEQAFAAEMEHAAPLLHLNITEELLDRAIQYERRQVVERIFGLLARRYDRSSILHIRESLLAGDERHRANALEMLDSMLPHAIKERLHTLIEDAFLRVKVQTQILPSSTLLAIARNSAYSDWTRQVASHFASSHTTMPQLFERVSLLHKVDLFSETPDAVLFRVAESMEQIEAPSGVQLITKGELGTCLYIIVRGSVKVHDGEHTLARLAEGTVVGELALLDPEPRSASVSTLETTTLLRLDWEVFYDLMTENVEIARGALATLARRIRSQNETIAKLSASTSS